MVGIVLQDVAYTVIVQSVQERCRLTAYPACPIEGKVGIRLISASLEMRLPGWSPITSPAPVYI